MAQSAHCVHDCVRDTAARTADAIRSRRAQGVHGPCPGILQEWTLPDAVVQHAVVQASALEGRVRTLSGAYEASYTTPCNHSEGEQKGGSRIRTGDHSICSRKLYH